MNSLTDLQKSWKVCENVFKLKVNYGTILIEKELSKEL